MVWQHLRASNAADTWNDARAHENSALNSYNAAMQNAYEDYVQGHNWE